MNPRTLDVRMLGRFVVRVDGRPTPDSAWGRRRAAAVIKMLALAPQHRLTREQVIEALWPDLQPRAGAANLRKAAHHARGCIARDDAVVLAAGMVELAPGTDITTDVANFEEAAADALRRDDVQACRRAAALYTGDLLPDDRYADWCALPREDLRRRYLAVLRSGQLWGRVLELEPADETAHREIVRAHAQAGDRSAAIRQFDRMRTALREELGVSPDARSLALYEQILAVGSDEDAPTPAERARSLLAWGVVHWERKEADVAERAALEARALAIDAGLGRELAEASELLGLIAYAQGRWRELFSEAFIESLRRAPELSPFVFDANMCMSEFALGEPDGLRDMTQFARELLATASGVDSQRGRALALLLRGEAALLSGDGSPAVAADLQEAAELHDLVGATSGLAIAVERLAEHHRRQGRDDGQTLHRRALALAESSAIRNHLLLFVYGGMIAAANGDGPRPMDAMEPMDSMRLMDIVAEAEAVEAGEATCDPCSMPFHVAAVRACAGVGDLQRAREHLAQAERISAMWSAGPWHAAVTEARAVLLAAEGAGPDAVRPLLQQAAAEFAAADRARDAARCLAAA